MFIIGDENKRPDPYCMVSKARESDSVAAGNHLGNPESSCALGPKRLSADQFKPIKQVESPESA
jgi:hypothetical protein